MRVDEYEQRMRKAIGARGSEPVRASTVWEAFVAVAREPVDSPYGGDHESFRVEVERFERSVVTSVRRRLWHESSGGDEVHSTTFHCELIIERPPEWDDGYAVVLDERTEPAIRSLVDLDRQGRATPAMQLVLKRYALVNVFAEGAT